MASTSLSAQLATLPDNVKPNAEGTGHYTNDAPDGKIFVGERFKVSYSENLKAWFYTDWPTTFLRPSVLSYSLPPENIRDLITDCLPCPKGRFRNGHWETKYLPNGRQAETDEQYQEVFVYQGRWYFKEERTAVPGQTRPKDQPVPPFKASTPERRPPTPAETPAVQGQPNAEEVQIR